MKKLCILLLLTLPIILEFCSSSKKATASKVPPKITYDANVQQVMIANCSPCHMPPKGFKKPYDNYVAVKSDIDDILTRIQEKPGEPGFMPFKHPRMSDSTIQVYVQWKKDGLLEK